MTAKPIRVLAADDHSMVLEGIEAIVSAEAGMAFIAGAPDGAAAIELSRRHRPDVVIMDMHMPDIDGIQTALALRAECPDARILVLATHPGDMQARLAFRAGVSAYLPKSTVRRDLVRAIRDLGTASPKCPAGVGGQFVPVAGDEVLTRREIEVLEAVAAGHPNRHIALQLGVTEETVKTHLKRIFAKLGARGRTHALVLGYRRGALPLPSWI